MHLSEMHCHAFVINQQDQAAVGFQPKQASPERPFAILDDLHLLTSEGQGPFPSPQGKAIGLRAVRKWPAH